MGRIRKIRNFEGLQELHYGFGYASAFIPFLQAFKNKEIIITFAYKKTKLYTQKGILPFFAYFISILWDKRQLGIQAISFVSGF